MMQRADRAALRLHALRPQARLQLLCRRQAEGLRRLAAAWQRRMDSDRARLRHADAVLRAAHPQRRLARLRERLTMGDDVLGQAIAEVARYPHRVAFIDRIGELDLLAIRRQQRDVEIPRVQQFPDQFVDVGVETLKAAGRHRQLGDLVQRALQALGPLALDDLGL